MKQKILDEEILVETWKPSTRILPVLGLEAYEPIPLRSLISSRNSPRL